ncbi:VOC family protein [Aneurinibacillus terranovensis]|uniref:VOC family protein n=1 Tax=Aneurinibacillus terranovensis TaxID=278991 RepID=UPI00041FBE8C|nr:VOC family protein [Aneurinibacillus terranovensis]
MVKKINHIAIIVEDIEKSLVPYKQGLGLKPTDVEYVESYDVRVAFLPIGDTQIELVQPMGNDGDLVEFLKKTGGGLHHIALEVEDIHQTIHRLDQAGIPLKDRSTQKGAHNSTVTFAEQTGFDGVVIELVEPAK